MGAKQSSGAFPKEEKEKKVPGSNIEERGKWQEEMKDFEQRKPTSTHGY